MTQITAPLPQTVASGDSIIFTDGDAKKCCSCIIHNDGSSITTLKGNTKQCFATYKVSFSSNIAATVAGEITLAITINGEPVRYSIMAVTPTATGAYFNVAKIIEIKVPKCCCVNIAVRNITATAISASNTSMVIERIA